MRGLSFLLLIFLIACPAFGEALDLSGEGIQIKRYSDFYEYFISSGTVKDSEGATISGANIRLCKKDEGYHLHTDDPVYFSSPRIRSIHSQGMDYYSGEKEGVLAPPVVAYTDDGVLSSDDPVRFSSGSLSGDGSFVFRSEEHTLYGTGYYYGDDVITVAENIRSEGSGGIFLGDKGRYDLGSGELILSSPGEFIGNDRRLFFDDLIFNEQTGDLKGSNIVIIGDTSLSGARFTGLMKEGQLVHYRLEGDPVIELEGNTITGKVLIGDTLTAEMKGTPMLTIHSNTETIQLFPEELLYSISEKRAYCTKIIRGSDTSGRIYFARGLELFRNGDLLINNGFTVYGTDHLLSSISVRMDSGTMTLSGDGHLIISPEDEAEYSVYFSTAVLDDISAKRAFLPFAVLERPDELARCDSLNISWADTRTLSGRNLELYSEKDKFYLQTPEFYGEGDLIFFPTATDLFSISGTMDRSFDLDPSQVDQQIKASKAYYDRSSGELYATGVLTKQEQWWIYSRRLLIKDSTTLYLKGAKVTTCDNWNPHYHFAVSDLKIIREDKMMFRSALYYIGGLPILYLPFYVRDIDPDEGMLVTRLGRESYSGYFIKNKILFRPDGSTKWKLNLLLDYMTERDLGLGVEGKYKIKNGSGEGIVYFNRDWNNIFVKDSSYTDMYKVNISALQRVYGAHMRLSLDLSNESYMNRYFQAYDDYINQKEFINKTSVSGNIFKLLHLSAAASFRKYEYASSESTEETLPSISLSLRRIPIGPLYLQMNNNYLRKNSVGSGASSAVLSVKPLNMRILTLNFGGTFAMSYRQNAKDSQYLTFLHTPLTIGLSSNAYRIYGSGDLQIKHTVNPSLSFRYDHPFPISSEADLIGTAGYFSSPVRSLSFKMKNLISYKIGDRVKNFGELSLSGYYDFSLKKIPGIQIYSTISPYRLSLSAYYDLLAEELKYFNLSTSKSFGKFNIYTTLYKYAEFTQTLALSYSGENLTFRIGLGYNYHGSNIAERFYKRDIDLSFPLHCFVVKLTYQQQYIGNALSLNKFLFSVEIGKFPGSDLKIEGDFLNDILSVMGNREPMPI